MGDVPIPMGFWAIFVPQLQTSNSNSSQGLNCSSPLTDWLTHRPTYSTQLTPKLAAILHQPRTLLTAVSRAEQSRAVTYCWQPASTVTPGIEPRWDPWPYICSVSRLLFFFSFCCSSFDKKGRVGLFYNWCSLTTPYSTQGHIKVRDIYILYIIHKTQTDTKFYYIQGHLSVQDSASAYASTYLNLRNGS
jgi:hypothetical protein